jgi:hypothetical protein
MAKCTVGTCTWEAERTLRFVGTGEAVGFCERHADAALRMAPELFREDMSPPNPPGEDWDSYEPNTYGGD